MKCDEARLALSAMLDGETPAVAAETVAEHLAGCAGCRHWRAEAERVGRLVRVRSAEPVPDLTEQVLTAVHAERAAAGGLATTRHGGWWPLRIAVAALAAVQLVLALPELFASHGSGVHISREGASFDIAVAVGFLLVARYPHRARALLPVAGMLGAALLLTTGVDIASGATSLLHEVGHALVVVQAALLWALSRISGQPAHITPALRVQ